MRWLIATFLVSLMVACSGNNNNGPTTQCNDGIDNDGDGMIDFPDDLGCTSATDDSEDSPPSPQCSDGRDNDGDGKLDYPYDPGCFAPQQDTEVDDCPDGPGCPQCSDGKDNDMNGTTDFPNDPGCTSAADNDEYTDNPAACGANVQIKQLAFDGSEQGMLMTGNPSVLTSPTCGGSGPEDVYELRISSPKVVVASTDNAGTAADTVLYIRSADCSNPQSEMACNDDAMNAQTMGASTITVSISTPGTYYLIVDAHDSGSGGAYDLSVKFLTGEGESCAGPSDCGPGLICRIPLGGTEKKCSKHVCSDGVDDDATPDGKNDYPEDPGCTSPDDDDESDPCPGAGCPECADGMDNDSDGKTDWPMDPTCTSASSASESCISTDGVAQITAPSTNGDTTTAHNDVHPACSFSGATANDLTYRLDVPALASLTITTTPGFDAVTALYDSTCGGTALDCQDTSPITKANLAAGTYFVVVDGWSSGSGTFTLDVTGKIAIGGACNGPLVAAGVLSCVTGSACDGTTHLCKASACADGMDNDSDGKFDFPNDPGCTDPSDNTEGDPATAPVCSDNTDNDGDGPKDWGGANPDVGCSSAAGTSEAFCTTEHDTPPVRILTKVTTGTTTGKSNDETATCASSAAPDVAFGLELPVPVASLQIDTQGSSFDTVLTMWDTACATMLQCKDDGFATIGPSLLQLNNVAPGGYAVVVDGYSGNSGAFTLNVSGTVADGTLCNFPEFQGATPILACNPGKTCTGTPKRCQ